MKYKRIPCAGLLSLMLLASSCTTIHHNVKLPKTVMQASSHFLGASYYEGVGANFFNEDESYDRMLAAKRMGIQWIRLSPSKWKSSLYPSEPGTFLIGRQNADRGLIEEDLKKLITVLGWAQELELKVALTFLSVPGRLFAQHNGGIQGRMATKNTFTLGIITSRQK